MKTTHIILFTIVLFFACSKKENLLIPVVPALTMSLEPSIYNNKQTSLEAVVLPVGTNVSKVDFYVDGILTTTLFTPPFKFNFILKDLKTGAHKLSSSATFADSKVLTCENSFTFKIRLADQYQGGVIIKIAPDSLTGVIASRTDLTGGVLGMYKYGAYNGDYGAYSTDDGYSNTYKFEGKFDANYAAIACLNLDLNGYSDWYLPALNELLLFENFKPSLNIPERTGNTYWSSTGSDTDPQSAYSHSFSGALGQPCDMQRGYYVRPLRKF